MAKTKEAWRPTQVESKINATLLKEKASVAQKNKRSAGKGKVDKNPKEKTERQTKICELNLLK